MMTQTSTAYLFNGLTLAQLRAVRYRLTMGEYLTFPAERRATLVGRSGSVSVTDQDTGADVLVDVLVMSSGRA